MARKVPPPPPTGRSPEETLGVLLEIVDRQVERVRLTSDERLLTADELGRVAALTRLLIAAVKDAGPDPKRMTLDELQAELQKAVGAVPAGTAAPTAETPDAPDRDQTPT